MLFHVLSVLMSFIMSSQADNSKSLMPRVGNQSSWMSLDELGPMEIGFFLLSYHNASLLKKRGGWIIILFSKSRQLTDMERERMLVGLLSARNE